ncbi:MAG: ribosome biogenesis GTP-binding protein YihA/YsxC [Polyangiaceae bacterium]
MTSRTTSREANTAYRIADARFVGGATDAKGLPEAGPPEVAFCGRSNVGKSSLLNMLVQRKNLVRTSRTPGCTRQINFFDVDVAGKEKWQIRFVDLPGYGYAARAKGERSAWQAMIEGYFRARETWRGAVILVDVSRGIEDEERELVEFLASLDHAAPYEIVTVATKIDRLSLSDRKPALAACEKTVRAAGQKTLQGHVIGTSASNGDGRELVWKNLERIAKGASRET